MKKIILAAVLAGLGSTSALAADLGARTYTKAPAMMDAVSNWTGFYIGGNVGYGWGDGKTSLLPTDNRAAIPATTLDSDPKGVIGGAQIGYNWQVGTILAGLETDIQTSDIKGSAQATLDPHFGPTIASANSKLSWFGTLRARIGVAVAPNLLLYGTGGFAYGHIKDLSNIQIANPPFSDHWPASISKTATGWAAGAGAEWMFARNWSAKAEYLHVDLGNTSATAIDVVDSGGTLPTNLKYTWKHQYDLVRAGVNYHF